MSGFLKSEGSINYYKIVAYVIGILGLIGVGFLLGRKTTEPETVVKTEYKTLPAIHDTIRTPVPHVIIPAIDTEDVIKACILSGKYWELFPEKIKDSIIYVSKSDSTKIMKEWACTREYKETLFNIDTIGKCDVDISVQYNEVKQIGYNFVPIRKTTDTKEIIQRQYEPFLGGGLTTQTVVGQAGIFFEEKYGISFLYQRDYLNKSNIYGGVVLFKF